MPGLVGVLAQRGRSENRAELARMQRAMLHEDFYHCGACHEEELGVSIGWITHPGEWCDCMPIVNSKGDLKLFFYGEDFSGGASAAADNDRTFGGPASRLLRSYEQDPRRFFAHLNGWFSGVLIDLQNQRVDLFCDRYGMRRLYYIEFADRLYFASEAKALAEICSQIRAIDPRSLAELTVVGCTLERRSLYQSLEHLPPAALWSWSSGRLSQKRYFRPRQWMRDQTSYSSEIDFIEAGKELLAQVTPAYARNRRRLAISLSSGLDTRTILAALRLRGDESLPSYTFGGPSRDTLDMRFAEKIAKQCRLNHRTLRLGSEFFTNFGELAAKTIRVSDGLVDVCATHDLLLNAQAREIAPVRLTGKFGSEVLRRGRVIEPGSVDTSVFHPEFRPYLEAVQRTYEAQEFSGSLRSAVFGELPAALFAKMQLEHSQVIVRSPFLDNRLVELMFDSLPGGRDTTRLQLELISDLQPALLDVPTDRGSVRQEFRTLHLKILFRLLAKVDHYYLSHCPTWLAGRDAWLPRLVDSRLAGFQKFERYRIWFRDQLSEFVKEVVLDPQTLRLPYFDADRLEAAVLRHLAGESDCFRTINKAATIALIVQTLFRSR